MFFAEDSSELQRESAGETKRKMIFHLLSKWPQQPGLEQAKNLELHAGLPTGWQGPKQFSHLALLFPSLWQKTGSEMEPPGLESTPMWEVGVVAVAQTQPLDGPH